MIVASDFDGTLTAGEMWRGVARYVRDHGRGALLQRFMLLRLPNMLLSRIGIGSRSALRNRFMEQLPQVTAGMSEAEVRDLAVWVVENELWPKRRQPVLDELAAHQRDGKRVIVISGAYQPILETFTAKISAEAIGTPLEFGAGKLTGKLGGVLNVGEAKAARLRATLNGQTLAVAYGDTENDLPMLRLAQTAVAVNPDAALRAAAVAGNWRIIEVAEGRRD